MELMLPLIAMFVVIGLTQTRVTQRAYVRAIGVIIVLSLYYLLSFNY